MLIQNCNLLNEKKSKKHNLTVDIELYPYASELYEELNSLGVVQRMKETPQLGVIKVPKQFQKTRLDYVMLQLYLHQLVKKNLQMQLRYTYNNYIRQDEFEGRCSYNDECQDPTMADVLQLLTIAYNIGHFYNTFTASRAVIMMASQNPAFKAALVSNVDDSRFKNAMSDILEKHNYQRFHLLNSLLILERCDSKKQSVSLAKEIVYSYLSENSLQENSKLHYAFLIFRDIRTVSYLAYDLQMANTPLTIDLCNEKGMLLILRELLSKYNNTLPLKEFVKSVTKLLDDTVYNENADAVCYYQISKKIVSILKQTENFTIVDYYNELFWNRESCLNRRYAHKRDYVKKEILKITFDCKHRFIAENLRIELDRINYIRVGYYDRHSGEQTVLVSIKKKCSTIEKRKAAYKVLKCTISHLRKVENIEPHDLRFLLCTKFFLYYLFDENPVEIKPTIDDKICVLCTRGRASRVGEIDKLLKKCLGSEDVRHETEFMTKCLEKDNINDTSICIPASILVHRKEEKEEEEKEKEEKKEKEKEKEVCEFDGMIIHPMRKEKQIVFLEAKNTNKKPSYGKNCLRKKLEKMSFGHDCNYDEIVIVGRDAKFEMDI